LPKAEESQQVSHKAEQLRCCARAYGYQLRVARMGNAAATPRSPSYGKGSATGKGEKKKVQVHPGKEMASRKVIFSQYFLVALYALHAEYRVTLIMIIRVE
jgi:hypothetical protein